MQILTIAKRYITMTTQDNDITERTQPAISDVTGSTNRIAGAIEHCTHDRKHGRKEIKDIVRCCTCMCWYHMDYLNVTKIEAKGF